MFNLSSQEQKIILFILTVIVLGAGYQYYRETKQSAVRVNTIKDIPNPATSPIIKTPVDAITTIHITVHVDGAVNKPGVYDLPVGSRVIHAIKAAGDTTGNADISNINYAESLQDGEKVTIPGLIKDTTSILINPSQALNVNPNLMGNIVRLDGNPPSSRNIVINHKININTASAQELDLLPGIGPSLAQKIIDYRMIHGPFHRIEQILDVKGIGKKRFEDMKNKITVN